MKKIVSLVLLSILSPFVFGQTISSGVVTPNNSETVSPLFTNPKLRNYEMVNIPGLKMRNTGRALTILGSALFIGGVITFTTADEKYYYLGSPKTNYDTKDGNPQSAAGTLMMVTGASMAIPGVILWSKGSIKYNEHLRQVGQTTSLQFKGNGLALNFRF